MFGQTSKIKPVQLWSWKMTNTISHFTKEYRWLSNFAPCKIILDGITYPSTENAYQAAKTLNLEERKYFETCTPSEAKKQGMKVAMREDWDSIKFAIMYYVNHQKFEKEPYKTQLLNTGNVELVEGNWWGDTYWGVCNGVGENNLGEIIMTIRFILSI